MRMRAASAPPAMPAYRATFMEAVGTQRLHLPADPTEPRRQGTRGGQGTHAGRPAAPGASGRGHPATLPAGHPAEATDPPPRQPLRSSPSGHRPSAPCTPSALTGSDGHRDVAGLRPHLVAGRADVEARRVRGDVLQRPALPRDWEETQPG